MTLAVDRFRNVFQPARPTLFKVQLNFPENNEETDFFYCKGAQIPSKNIGLIELSFMGRKIKYHGDSTFEDWTVTVYNDRSFTIKRKLEIWGEIINKVRDNISPIVSSAYKKDFSVFHLDEQENIIKEYKLVGAFPINTGDPIELGWDQNDTPEEYAITFAYDYWTTDVAN